MAMGTIRNITKTKKESSARNESEIKGYLYYLNNDSNTFYYADKPGMARQHKEGDRYFSVGKKTKPEAFWKQSVNNEWFLQTEPNASEEDNLLNLDDYEN
jgi:hypothetical protein